MKLLVYISLLSVCLSANAQVAEGFYPIKNGKPANVQIAVSEDAGVMCAVNALCADIEMVCGSKPQLIENNDPTVGNIQIGLTTSPLIASLVKSGQLDISQLKNKREMYLMVSTASGLIIVGSDKRGTIYGIYELSRRLGVSPWTWWADVPVAHRTDISIPAGVFTDGEPSVVYRGIFLNDEAPALSGWAQEKFGGFNHKFYAKVFELILRLRGNFMWPAMWGNAFYADDVENGRLANEMGIVIGTSHHEPLGRAHAEWAQIGKGEWNYATNETVLNDFWRGGMQRQKDYETVVTVGMRGDGDEAMGEATNISLLERIVRNQRSIISSVTGRKASTTPQVWALYKEVQDYYDKGMRVPDDVTLLLCDDNWGNVRRLPSLNAKPRKGGYGMYYHFDYVGGPRNYKWLNVTQVQRVWEQMNLCYRHGVKQLWIVNVGDLKPMEYPIQFFLDMAWRPENFSANNIYDHTLRFCQTQFGAQYSDRAAKLIDTYTKFNARRTPELLDADTYSIDNYNEWNHVLLEYKALELDAQRLFYLLPSEYRNAFDQLVLFPISACANLYEMYNAVALNKKYAAQNDVRANRWATIAKQCYERDSLLTIHYNKDISNGKWNHFMDQTHIGYTYWQQPEQNSMPALRIVPEPRIAPAPPIFDGAEGYVSIEAEHVTRKSGEWSVIPNLGRSLSGVTAVSPNAETWIEYEFDIKTVGEANVQLLFSPTLDFTGRGLKYAVSVDGADEIIVDIHGSYDMRQMEQWQANHINISESKFKIVSPGRHTLRIRPLDEGLVLQKVIVDMGGLLPSYLGAPESITL